MYDSYDSMPWNQSEDLDFDAARAEWERQGEPAGEPPTDTPEPTIEPEPPTSTPTVEAPPEGSPPAEAGG